MQRFEEIVLLLLLVCVKTQAQVRRRGQETEGKPERCDRPTEFMNQQCCVFPPFFRQVIAKGCGAIFSVKFIDTEHDIAGLRRGVHTRGSGCEYWQCILKKYGFITKDDSVDDEKYFNHLEKWAELNPTFSAILSNAQVHCKNSFRMFMPLAICEFRKFNACIRNFVTLDCPAIMPTPQCKEKKLFYDECREYFY